MSRHKLGTPTGCQFTDGNPILVGNNISVDGAFYYVNTYLQAVPYGVGVAVSLRELCVKWPDFIQSVETLPSLYKQMGEVYPCKGSRWEKKKEETDVLSEQEEMTTGAAEDAPSASAEEVKVGFSQKARRMRVVAKGFLPKAEEKTPAVDHPGHYNSYSVEVIDMMIAIFGKDKVADFCEVNAFKYRMRAGSKDGNSVETDLQKERWYLDKAKELRG